MMRGRLAIFGYVQESLGAYIEVSQGVVACPALVANNLQNVLVSVLFCHWLLPKRNASD